MSQSTTIIATVTHTMTEDGANIVMNNLQTGETVKADIIAPEGDGIDCWMGTELAAAFNALPEHLFADAVRDMADWAFGEPGAFEICDDVLEEVKA